MTAHPLAAGAPSPWAAEWGQDRYGPFEVLQLGEVRYRMRWIKPGTFWMGSSDEDPERYRDEEPCHKVRISRGFWLGETPCTQALWEAVMGKKPSRFDGASRPVERVSWDDCQEFFHALEVKAPGFGGRLPSEAEWEHACRGGPEGARWAAEREAIAWYDDNSGGETHPVTEKGVNPFGLFDMLGNVYEWCQDRYGDYSAEDAIDPQGPDVGRHRVIRGGSWYGVAGLCRAAYRGWDAPEGRYDYVGFRLARGPGTVRGGGAP